LDNGTGNKHSDNNKNAQIYKHTFFQICISHIVFVTEILSLHPWVSHGRHNALEQDDVLDIAHCNLSTRAHQISSVKGLYHSAV
jgi:hypothetical protein